jgi:branched chain amino acid efflux pump
VTVWLVVLAVGAATVIFKASGPVLLGRRPLPAPIAAVVALLGPVLLAALVVTQTVGGDGQIVLDARLAAARAPLPLVVVVAAATTALVRLLT